MKTNAVRLLERLRVPFELQEYEVDLTDLAAETVARKIGLPAEQVFKTLVARGDKHGVCLAVVPGDCQLNLKALARATGDKKIDTVPLKDVEPLTGYIRGGVTALACKKDYPVFLDETAQLWDIISISAGMRGLQILLAPDDYLRVTKATIAPISQSKPQDCGIRAVGWAERRKASSGPPTPCPSEWVSYSPLAAGPGRLRLRRVRPGRDNTHLRPNSQLQPRVGEVEAIHDLFGRLGRGPGCGKVAQGVGQTVVIAVEPICLIAVNGCQNSVLPRYLGVQERLSDGGLVAKQDAVTVDPLAGDTIEPLGEINSLELELRGPAGLDIQGHAPDAETVFGELVAVGRDSDKDPLAHQPRFMKRNHAGGVRVVVLRATGGLELDHRHPSTGLVVDELDGEVVRQLRRGGQRAAHSWAPAEVKEGSSLAR